MCFVNYRAIPCKSPVMKAEFKVDLATFFVAFRAGYRKSTGMCLKIHHAPDTN